MCVYGGRVLSVGVLTLPTVGGHLFAFEHYIYFRMCFIRLPSDTCVCTNLDGNLIYCVTVYTMREIQTKCRNVYALTGWIGVSIQY